MTPLYLCAIVSLVILLLRQCLLPVVRLYRMHRALAMIPVAEPGHWLLGHIPVVLKIGSDEERFKRWTADGKRLVRMEMRFLTEIVLVHPETASVLLKTAEPKFESVYGFLRDWLGDGLLISAGKRWARDRRLLTRGFHFDILRGYLPVYKDAMNAVFDQWADDCRHGNGSCEVNATECCKEITLETTLRCIMSFNPRTQSEESKKEMEKYVDSVHTIAKLLHNRYTNPFLHSNLIFSLSTTGRQFYKNVDGCHSVSQGLINKRRHAIARMKEEQSLQTQEDQIFALRKESLSGYLDFLDILLTVQDEDGRGLSDKEIQEQVDTFLFEGHDTTASAMQWTLWYLAKHPDLQEKCREEIQELVGDDKDLSYEVLGRLDYLTQFIKESMRLGAPVPYVGRTLSQPLVIDGYELPAGTNITVAMLAIHRHPDVWEQPLEFDPDRFTVENSAKRHPYAFVPFSAGPRNCIGQTLAMDELKSLIALILLRFRVSVDPSVVKPRIKAMMVSRPTEPIRVTMHEL